MWVGKTVKHLGM